jgi:hypothetical protein
VNGPGYWRDETTGVLLPAVTAYLRLEPMSDAQIAALRAYLRQWIMAPVWQDCAALAELRERIAGLTFREAIDDWLNDALLEGIDPL